MGAVFKANLRFIIFGFALACAARTVEAKSVVILGDSLAQGLGAAFQRCFKNAPDVELVLKGKLNSGLTKKVPVDWVAEASELAKTKPDVAVVQIGGNDVIPLTIDGKFTYFGTDVWKAEYARRVASIVAAFKDNGTKVYWVGLPFPQRADLQEPYRTINAAMGMAMTDGIAKFYDIWDTFLVDGKFSSYGPDIYNKPTLIRAEDGTHLTAAGYTRVANMMVPEIAEKLSITGANCAP